MPAVAFERDAQGRVKVDPDLTVPGHAELFVLGEERLDLAAQAHIGSTRLVEKRSACAGCGLLQGGKENLPFGHGAHTSQWPVPSLNA